MFLNPIHANFRNPILWEAEGVIEKNDHSLKVGVKSLTTTRQIPLPDVSDEQRIKFGILCAKQVCKDKKWNSWADNWLSGQDRSTASASATCAYAAAAYSAAAYSAAAAGTAAAHAAAYAATCAYAAAAATHAAYSATYATSSAAHAAYSATYAAHIPIDLAAIAQCAIQEENKS